MSTTSFVMATSQQWARFFDNLLEDDYYSYAICAHIQYKRVKGWPSGSPENMCGFKELDYHDYCDGCDDECRQREREDTTFDDDICQFYCKRHIKLRAHLLAFQLGQGWKEGGFIIKESRFGFTYLRPAGSVYMEDLCEAHNIYMEGSMSKQEASEMVARRRTAREVRVREKKEGEEREKQNRKVDFFQRFRGEHVEICLIDSLWIFGEKTKFFPREEELTVVELTAALDFSIEEKHNIELSLGKKLKDALSIAEDHKNEREKYRGDIHKLQEELKAAQTAMNDAYAQLHDTREHSATVIAQLQTELRDTQDQIEQVEEEKEDLQFQVQVVRAALAITQRPNKWGLWALLAPILNVLELNQN